MTEGLLSKVRERAGLNDKLLKYLQKYLTERTYQVNIGDHLSEPRKLNKGLPKGSILSPILFNIMMSDIPTNPHVDILTYADDIVIHMSGSNPKFIGRKVQSYLNELNEWFEKWGFKLSWAKTTPVLFSKNPKTLS